MHNYKPNGMRVYVNTRTHIYTYMNIADCADLTIFEDQCNRQLGVYGCKPQYNLARYHGYLVEP